MSATRALWSIATLLGVFVLAASIAAYPALPAEIPTGLDANGAPHGMARKSSLAWLAAPLFMTGLTISLGVLSRVVHRFPKAVSAGPGVDIWRTLPLDARYRTAEPIRTFMAFVGAFTMLLSGVIQFGMYEAALGRPAGWILPVVLIMSVLPLPVGLGIILRDFEDDVKAERRRIDASGSAAALWLGVALLLLAPSAGEAQAVRRLAPASSSDVDVSVRATGAVLSGTLRLPDGVAKPPLVVLVAGSGPTDRNGNSPMGLAPNTLKQLAESLSVAGIASYRFDKRGVAASAAPGIREDAMRFEHFADDIAAVIRALADDGRVGRVVIAGHSEGALLGLLAARHGNVAGYVSIAGVARPAHLILHDQLAAQLPAPLLAKADSALARLAAGQQPVPVPPGLEALFRPSVQPYLVSWFRHSGEEAIRRWNGPCLLIQGTHDLQVPTSEAERLKAAQPRCDLVVRPGMNHVLKTTPPDAAGQAASYRDPGLPLSAGLVEPIVRFVRSATNQKTLRTSATPSR